jgi:hypothetical protein
VGVGPGFQKNMLCNPQCFSKDVEYRRLFIVLYRMSTLLLFGSRSCFQTIQEAYVPFDVNHVTITSLLSVHISNSLSVVELMLIMTNGLIFQNASIPQQKKDSYGVLMIIVLMVIVVITGSRVIFSVFRSVLKIYQGKNQMNVTSLEAVGSPTLEIEKEYGTMVDTAAADPVASTSGFALRVQSIPAATSKQSVD